MCGKELSSKFQIQRAPEHLDPNLSVTKATKEVAASGHHGIQAKCPTRKYRVIPLRCCLWGPCTHDSCVTGQGWCSRVQVTSTSPRCRKQRPVSFSPSPQCYPPPSPDQWPLTVKTRSSEQRLKWTQGSIQYFRQQARLSNAGQSLVIVEASPLRRTKCQSSRNSTN